MCKKSLMLLIAFALVGGVAAAAGFNHDPMHRYGPRIGDIVDVQLVTFHATVDGVLLPMFIVTDDQSVQWTMTAGSTMFWEQEGFEMHEGDSLRITGADVLYGYHNEMMGGFHNGDGQAFQGGMSHFVVFSIMNDTTGQSMMFRDPETGWPMWHR